MLNSLVLVRQTLTTCTFKKIPPAENLQRTYINYRILIKLAVFRISKFPLRCHQLKQESLLWDRKLILSLSKSLLLCTPQVSRFELNFLSHLLYWLVSAVFLCPPVSSVYCFVGFHHNDCVFLDVPSLWDYFGFLLFFPSTFWYVASLHLHLLWQKPFPS